LKSFFEVLLSFAQLLSHPLPDSALELVRLVQGEVSFDFNLELVGVESHVHFAYFDFGVEVALVSEFLVQREDQLSEVDVGLQRD
jgi:hypothetical protein